MGNEQCGAVNPVWVKWEGVPQREKLFAIDYRRCKCTETELVEKWGSQAYLCKEHAK